MRSGPAGPAPVSARELKAAAFERVQARRRPPRYREGPDGFGGTARWQVDGGSEYLEPANVSEWIDDRQVRCADGPGAPDVLVHLFERLRGGVGAVPAAVAFAADRLRDHPHGQYVLWTILDGTPTGPADVQKLRIALSREWKRRRLQTTAARGAGFTSDPLNRTSPRPGKIAYATPYGHPAGPAWLR